MSKGKEKQTHEFLRGSANPSTPMPPSDPNLMISLFKHFQGFNLLQLTSRFQWTFKTKRLSHNLFTQVSHTLKLLQLRWRNENYNETHSMNRYSKMKNKKWFNVLCFASWRLKISHVLFLFACWRGSNWVGFEFL